MVALSMTISQTVEAAVSAANLSDFEKHEHRNAPYRYEGAPSAIRRRGGEIAGRTNRLDRV